MSDRPHTVRFSNLDREILVPDNANLREICLREGVKLYFGLAPYLNCRGRARCGTCRVRVQEGQENLSVPSPFERKRLPDARADLRLACQANVRGPVVIDTRGKL